MAAAWTHLRRAVASVMLVAMTAFVLHGGAMAGSHRHGPAAASDCGSHAGPGHAHAGAHHHAEAAQAADDGHAHHGDESAAAEPCCGSVCSVAISSRAPETVSRPLPSPIVLMPDAAGGPDSRPDGLKRPPRTTDIA